MMYNMPSEPPGTWNGRRALGIFRRNRHTANNIRSVVAIRAQM